jgi:hypothetical protein
MVALPLCACASGALEPDGFAEPGTTEEVELGTLASALIVPPSDPSPPALAVVGVAEATSGRSISASSGGTPQALQLSAKAGALHLLTAAVDDESGIASLSLWCNRTITLCDGDACTTSGPGLLSAPCFASGGAPVAPGQEAPNVRELAQSIDLATQIPQGTLAPGQTRTTVLLFHAQGENNFGLRSSTAEARVVWEEVGAAPPPPPPPPQTCAQRCAESCVQGCPSGREFRTCQRECRTECAVLCRGG